MSGTSINFDDKKKNLKWLLKQKQKNININDIDVNNILLSRNMVNIIHSNTLLGIMMMLLNHYI